LGINVWNYTTTDLFNNSDPFYFADETPSGMMSVGPSSVIVHGSFAPVFISRQYLAGVEPNVSNAIKCTNCPTLGSDLTQYQPQVIIEPTTGKTVGGNKRGQFNIEIGQPYLFKDGIDPEDDADLIYQYVPNVFMPVFVFEDYSLFGQDQANQIQDGLDDIDYARSVQKGAKIGGSVAAAICWLGAIILGIRWYQIKNEPETWTDQGGEYNEIN